MTLRIDPPRSESLLRPLLSWGVTARLAAAGASVGLLWIAFAWVTGAGL